MSTNSSSPLNITPTPNPYSFYEECQKSTSSNVIFITYTFFYLLITMPLYTLTLYLGFQRWRNQRSLQTTHHSDSVTFNMAIVEFFEFVASVSYCLSIYLPNISVLLALSIFVVGLTYPGQVFLPCLTCLEHYMAVAHAITYMKFRNTIGVRIRNISIVCVWLLSFGWIPITRAHLPDFPLIPFVSISTISIAVVSFCCLSVLCALTNPGPGNAAAGDQSKRRAFHIIAAILGALLLRFFGVMLGFGLPMLLPGVPVKVYCVLMDIALFLTVPSSLILPLLFLHKAGKLACCKRNIDSG